MTKNGFILIGIMSSIWLTGCSMIKPMENRYAGGCKVYPVTLKRDFQALVIENDILYAQILVDKGADIYQLIYKPSQVDILWKSPWGIREPYRAVTSAFDSFTAAEENYPGGWQGIFPSGGGPCEYKGGELNFHGEAAMVPWEYEIVKNTKESAEVVLSCRLYRSPFRLERRFRVEKATPILFVHEKITNVGGEEMEYMWGHHPALGKPFISPSCRIQTGARRLIAEPTYNPEFNPMEPGREYSWPMVSREQVCTDLSFIPKEGMCRACLGYLMDFETGWYAVTNPELGFGFGLVWPETVFPYAWFWQEMYATPGFPWYKGVYVMAIEPFTSYPSQGLCSAIENGTQRRLAPGESVEMEIKAVFYEDKGMVEQIEKDGTVHFGPHSASNLDQR
jgi:hypothetical protein